MFQTSSQRNVMRYKFIQIPKLHSWSFSKANESFPSTFRPVTSVKFTNVHNTITWTNPLTTIYFSVGGKKRRSEIFIERSSFSNRDSWGEKAWLKGYRRAKLSSPFVFPISALHIIRCRVLINLRPLLRLPVALPILISNLHGWAAGKKTGL